MEEIWKDIEGYEGLYQASNFGRIRTTDGKQVFKPNRQASLTKNGIKTNSPVARIVMSTFNGQSSFQIRYKDGDAYNSRLDNLEYVSPESDEVWCDIPEYNGLYQITEKGRIRSFNKYKNREYPEGRLLSTYVNSFYWMVNFVNSDRKQVHRLLAMTFIPNPDNLPFVNHIDGNKLNNEIPNLEWCDASHNIKEAYRIGLNPRVSRPGEKSNFHKLTWTQVRVIREALQLGHSHRKIGKYFKVSGSTIGMIRNNQRWVI